MSIMSSVKAILRKKKNKQGEFPIAIRITKNRKSSYLYTGHYVELAQWDDMKHMVKKNHPNSTRLNNLILQKLSEASKTIIDSQVEKENFGAQHIKEKIRKTKDDNDFFTVAKWHTESLRKRKQHHQANTEEGRIEIFKNFIKTSNLPFNELNESLLYKFKSYLIGSRKLSERTVVNYLILIRTIYNLAILEKIADQELYPFGRGKISIRIPESEKIGLNTKEIQVLESLNLESKAKQHALNVWLFSFYLAGIRVGDVLKLQWKDVNDGRVQYRMNKNKKMVSLKLPEKASVILDTYRLAGQKKDDFIFPELSLANQKDPKDVTRKIQTATRKFNKHLKTITKQEGIDKNISMHIARHSFGNISGDKIPIQMLQKLYRHSSITTTISYQSNFMFKDEDDALDAVLQF
jgi:integrase